MASSAYASILKQLLNFTGTKYITLSEAIDYDMSYISKWVNGARLPASRHVEKINEDMARFFADIIQKKGREKACQKEFSLPRDGQELTYHLYQLLSAAYQTALHKPAEKGTKNADIQLYTNRADCHAALCQLLEMYLAPADKKTELLLTGQFEVLDKNGIWKLLEDYEPAGACDIHVGLKMDKFCQHMPQAANQLYHCLDVLLNYNFTLHEINHESYRNIIVLKGCFAFLYYVDAEDYMDLSLVITKPEEVEAISKKCAAYLMVQPKLLEPKETLGMERFGYRDIFFTSNKYLFFLTNGLEFLLPDEVYTSICKLVEAGKYPNATKEWVRRIQYIWYRIIEQGRMKIIMPKNSLIRYLETGCFYLTDMNYQMTPKERRDQLNLIVEKMKANPAITYGILLPASGKDSYANFTNLAFYGNYTSAFFKKNTHHIKKGVQPIYLLHSDQLITCLHQFFEQISTSRHYKEFSAENVDALKALITPLMSVLTKK